MGALELALFEADEVGGIRLVGLATDPDLVESVRVHILAERRVPLARLSREGEHPHVRLVPELDPAGDSGLRPGSLVAPVTAGPPKDETPDG